ncbi:hypothetical protein PIB30_106374 [Stylosanthes scabra]|uniref:Uncharacterized protein n=1 Tax=Stylosanthes scabra TaxID=79078 RepID=A0ABU6W212_9FABA|nr:hypothetical protein [Stylosanthes scabra]
MDRKGKGTASTQKGKEKIRAPPTRASPRLAAQRASLSPTSKVTIPPSRASPRLAALKAPTVSTFSALAFLCNQT